MDSATSSKMFLDIFEYFQYVRKPSNSQITQWHEKVRFIPLEAVDWIVSQITNQDKMPRNLPKTVIYQWYAYRKAHTEKTISEQYEYCSDCGGHGMHLFKKLNYDYNPPMKMSYVAMCSKCDNWKKQWGSVCRDGGRMEIDKKPIGMYVEKMPAVSKQQLIDLGLDYLPLSDPREKKIQVDVKKLARGIG